MEGKNVNKKTIVLVILVIIVVIAALVIFLSFNKTSNTSTDQNIVTNTVSEATEQNNNIVENTIIDEGTKTDEAKVQEIDAFTEYFNQEENNGFLLSTYDDILKIDVNALLYNGIGTSVREELPDAEKQAYMTAAGITDLNIQIFKLTSTQINDFLKLKTGKVLSDLTNKLSWTYLKEYDAYYTSHSDTNLDLVQCSGVNISSDGLYEITLKQVMGDKNYKITLKKSGLNYLVVSNTKY